jgi:two-component system OmpR family sensor kinase
VNHEFKTALTEIISSLELARLTGEYEDANKYSVSSARRLDSMLDTLGMLIHFVNSDYRKERVNLYSALDECIDDLERLMNDKHIKLDKKYNPQKAIYKYIDKSPLVLSFQNILKNAIKYSDIGGKIEISIFKDRFIIKDYGLGISQENLPKIFDRYFRESYASSGSGIGLSIIKRITEIYHWEIDIKSKK